METEELILRRTFALLLLKGFDGVSITDIQRDTNLSRGLLYHYFKNKEDLFIKVTEKFFIKIFDFDLSETKRLTVEGLVHYMCQRFDKINKEILDIIAANKNTNNTSIRNYHFLFYQVMQRDSTFRNHYQKTIKKERLAWEYALTNSINKNEIRNNTNTSFSAKQLFTLTDGIWFQNIFNNNNDSMIKNLKEALFHYINLLK